MRSQRENLPDDIARIRYSPAVESGHLIAPDCAGVPLTRADGAW